MPDWLGLPEGPVYNDDEIRYALRELPLVTDSQRREIDAYLQVREDARVKARERAAERTIGGLAR